MKIFYKDENGGIFYTPRKCNVSLLTRVLSRIITMIGEVQDEDEGAAEDAS